MPCVVPSNYNKILVLAGGHLKVNLVIADEVVCAHGSDQHRYRNVPHGAGRRIVAGAPIDSIHGIGGAHGVGAQKRLESQHADTPMPQPRSWSGRAPCWADSKTGLRCSNRIRTRGRRFASPTSPCGSSACAQYGSRNEKQQFQRAATLMCACEQIRQTNAERWRETPFRLSLWVGAKDDAEPHLAISGSCGETAQWRAASIRRRLTTPVLGLPVVRHSH
jgi:hypothetical protein